MMYKRLCAAVLAAMMLIGIFSGCKKEEKPSTEAAQQMQSEVAQTKFAYKASYEPISFDPALQVQYINGFCMSGDSLYMLAQCITGKEIMVDEITSEPYLDENQKPIEGDVSEMRLLRMELATRTVTQLGYRQMEPEEGKFGYTYVNSFSPGPDGSIWLAEQCSQYYYDLPENFDPATGNAYDYYVDDGMKVICRRFDSQGNELETITLDTPDDMYVGQVQFLADGSIYGSDWMNIYRFDKQGNIQGTLELENGMNTFLPISDTQIGVNLWEESGNVMKKLDAETMTLSEEIPIPENAYSLRQGMGEYPFLYESNNSVLGITADGESEKLFSWIDCDVDNSNFNGFFIADNGVVYALENVWETSTQTNSYTLVVMEPVDPATLPQKQVMTLACFNLPWELRTRIINFNKNHQDLRITVKDYAEYATNEDYYAGIQKLNTEILSGLVPDIIYTDSNMPISAYAAKGILQDLWPMIDSDPELSRDDLMTHFFDVLSTNGKLYQITDYFSIQTVLGRSDVIGQRDCWTLDELMEVYRTLEPDATIFGEMDTKADMLYSVIERSSNSFVDWGEMQCRFDTPEFIDLLSLVNSFPESFDYDNYDWDDYQSEGLRMRARKQMLLRGYVSSFDNLQQHYVMTDGNPCYVGYPSVNGTGNSFEVYGGLAISSKCVNSEAAWEFIRYCLTEEHQVTEYMWNFPTNKHAFDAYVKQCMTPNFEDYSYAVEMPIMKSAVILPEEAPTEETQVSDEPQEQPKGWYWFSDTEEVAYYALTQAELDLFWSLYENTNMVSGSNQAINTIIREETEAFFAGQKTAQETARLIQDRASLYVFEQG